MTVEKPVVGCLRLAPSQWKQLRSLWKSQGGIKWMNSIIQREARKAAKAAKAAKAEEKDAAQ